MLKGNVTHGPWTVSKSCSRSCTSLCGSLCGSLCNSHDELGEALALYFWTASIRLRKVVDGCRGL